MYMLYNFNFEQFFFLCYNFYGLSKVEVYSVLVFILIYTNNILFIK